MNFINLLDINVLSLVILAFVYIDARQRVEKTNAQHKLFMAMVYILAALLVVDSIARSFDGFEGQAAYLANLISNLFLYILVPVAPAAWVLYADYQIHQDEKRLRKIAVPLAAAVSLNALLALLSLSTGSYFFVDTANVYHRGPWFFAHMVMNFVIAVIPVFAVLKNRKHLDRKRFMAMLLFPIPTVTGAVLQSALYGTSLIWCCMTVSIVLIYLNIQAERLGTDYLTGVYNRRQLDAYVRDRVQGNTVKRTFSAILIDLDGFKAINDTYGHHEGDRALHDTVAVLKCCFRHGDFVSRYGGDEFLVVLDIDRQDLLEDAVARLKDSFNQFNQTRMRPYTLSFSIGYAVYDASAGMDPEQFIKHIDQLMYKDKRQDTGAA